jgi:hypothetical protein
MAMPESSPREPRHLIPFVMPEEVAEIDLNLRIPGRDGAPTLLWYLGRDAGDRPLAAVVFERPDHLRFRKDRSTVEEHHLERFLIDYRRGVGPPPIEAYRKGSNPPDFAVTINGAKRGLDITQFVVEERVAAFAAFRDVRSAAIQRGPKRFRHLAGQIVYVAMPRAEQRDIRGSAAQILDAVESLKPPARFNPQEPNWATAEFDGGYVTAGPLERAAGGAFYGLMGFELALTYSSVIYQADAWATLQRLVKQHDKPEIDVLLIVATAPVLDGFAFPSDGAAAFLALLATDRGASFEARYIREVYVHLWTPRAIYRLIPGQVGKEYLCEDIPFDHDLQRFHFSILAPEG